MTVGGTERTLTYDTNGNLTEERVIGGSTRVYQWDSINRLVAIQSDKAPVHCNLRTAFSYDGLSRRVRIVEKVRNTTTAWTVASDVRFVWSGTEIVQKPDLRSRNINTSDSTLARSRSTW